MTKITPIREDSEIVVHMNETRSYLQETRECQRYESKVCRVCGNPRLNLSPWCDDHFPWTEQKPYPLHQQLEKEGI